MFLKQLTLLLCLTGIMQNLFRSSPLSNLSDYTSISSPLLGTELPGFTTGFVEPAFVSDRPIYVLEQQCNSSDSVTVPITIGSVNAQKGIVLLPYFLVEWWPLEKKLGEGP